MQLTGIHGKAMVVTGAAQGIGAGIARALATEGARLVVGDRDAAHLDERAAELHALGADVAVVMGDLADTGSCTALIKRCVNLYGRVDALINVAGLLRAAPVLDLTVEDFDLTFRINTRAVFVCSQAAARVMVQQGGGTIITIASDMARIPRPLQSAYCASKAAVTHLMKCFGLELAVHGIRCASVLPGATDTEMVRQIRAAVPHGTPDAILRGSLEQFRLPIPLGQLASVEQVANAVLFLLSDQAAHITLTDLVVDGGGTLGA